MISIKISKYGEPTKRERMGARLGLAPKSPSALLAFVPIIACGADNAPAEGHHAQDKDRALHHQHP